jgi:DNA-cytosine methyltransferase
MKHLGLFEGIGGFSLAARWMGWQTVAWCEWDKPCQRVLRYHFPEAIGHDDIKQTDFTPYANTIDILTGGFPCQGFSNAGRQRGEEDERFLFPEMLRAIREIKPRWVVAENVSALTSSKFSGVFNKICTSMETEGYKVQSFIIPASAAGAEHERYRVWIIAYAKCVGLSGQGSLLGQLQPEAIGDRETNRFIDFIQRNAMPYVCAKHNGISRGLGEFGLHAAGNAIVPQVALQIYKAIQKYENMTHE